MDGTEKSNSFRRYLTGSAFSVAAALLTGVTGYLFRRAAATNLATDEYAFLYSCYSIVTVVCFLLDFGTSYGSALHIGKRLFSRAGSRLPEHLYSFFFWWKLAAGLAMCLLMAATVRIWAPAAGLAADGVSFGVILLFLTYLPAILEESHITAFLNASASYHALNLLMFAKSLAMLAGFYAFGLDLRAAVLMFPAGSVAFSAAGMIYLSGKCGFLPSIRSFPGVAAGTRFLLFLAGSCGQIVLCTQLVFHTDILALTLFGGPAEVALYSTNQSIAMIAISLMTNTVFFLLPVTASLWDRGNNGLLRRIFGLFLVFFTGCFYMAFLGAVLYGKAVLTLLFSEKFAAGAPWLPLQLPGCVLFLAGSTFCNILAGSPKPSAAIAASRILLASNLILLAVLLPVFRSAEAAAWAVQLSFLAFALDSMIRLGKQLGGFGLSGKKYLLLNAAGILFSGVAALFFRNAAVPGAGVAAGYLIFAVLLYRKEFRGIAEGREKSES